jgi:transposase
MARRGKKRRLGLEDEYWELIADGVGTVTACRQLGIGRKTGYRWRAETGGLAPQRDSEQMHSSRYLSLLDRQRIASLRARGLGVRQIAVLVGRSASTVSRELRRGTAEHDRGGYDGDLARARAQQRRTPRASGPGNVARVVDSPTGPALGEPDVLALTCGRGEPAGSPCTEGRPVSESRPSALGETSPEPVL